ncbi:peptide ABC transporter substrate-binding protein [[Bacillus thuringiensis] serovar konkukian]|uniref:peptide ABC transporter substrate-binding protein n=1 Tax=Bacillus thuringiensis TaxID=1428 RepID=UPI0007F15004|nr:peptide ABC transporter substrate-binding protein [Bacillus thuringiensis]ANN35528.1 peptide ABC transporter substrate-binding protein [Bacillus thuringiensis serovar coreanensis]MED1299431.1 peptide ABC transporter substrate-binding protein [Bacillus pacificus]OUA92175.1 peptide ABC transporter substrate-binding protein [[Bacillus thuringiensis] serovar konkukian]
MKKMKKVTAVVAPILVLSIALTACSGNGEKKANSEGKKSESKSTTKQVLNLLETSEIPSMDPSKATDSVSFIVLNNVMEGLYRLDKDNKPNPGVATSYLKSDDGKKYTFNLRKDAKWSNGDQVTAKDFVFAWQRLLDPNTGAEYAFIMYDIKNAKEINEGKIPADSLGVKAIDDYTLEVELVNAIPYFVELTSFPSFYPQNEKVVKEKGDKFGLEAENSVYNGPFSLAEWKHEQGWKYKKNDQYWDKKTVKLEEINVNVVKELSTRVNLYESGQADRVGLQAEYVDKYKSNKDEFKTELDPSTFFLRLNQKRDGQDTPLKNLKLRQAITKGFDKQSLATVILNDGSKPADFLVPETLAIGPDNKDFRKTFGMSLKDVTYDPIEAKQLWEEAKKELNTEQVTLELLNYDTDNAKKIGEYLKEQLETNLPGLTINLKNQPFKQKLKLETEQNYDISYAGWGPDYPDPMTFIDMFETTNSHNQMSYSNKEYDEIVKKGKDELLADVQIRWEQLGKAEELLLKDAAIAPMFQRGNSYLLRPYVHDIVSHNFGGDFSYKWAYISEKEAKK